ncbi:pentapeptide repeat-containing protein [Sphingomonas sp. CBMAI 2297]|uniref:pentapeptide repeat-containing protein n=1 Tax=Sphingomonas sp. CBMAI 2297 TaxID=2991720 RepID=UPI0024549505|nr:pentapeptide repeat-containing protein [Sphingomonas sp. CBMAI 2297]MDH4745181.1 pentapeptide repeat-containing protein [Sphingomonas sp. CBMAI 2297]
MAIEAGGVAHGEDLSAGEFGDADLAGARFENCVLRVVQLTGTCLQDARFRDCRIIRCRFANADLRDARFENCSFADDAGHAGVQFAFSQLDQVAFERCDLSFARIERSSLHAGALRGCNLRGAVFHKVDFGHALGRRLVKWAGVIADCNLELADLSELRMPDCTLTGSRLREALLFDAELEGADLRGCDFTNAQLAGAKLARADLRGGELAGMVLRELGSVEGMMVSADQQFALLTALGLDVHPD